MVVGAWVRVKWKNGDGDGSARWTAARCARTRWLRWQAGQHLLEEADPAPAQGYQLRARSARRRSSCQNEVPQEHHAREWDSAQARVRRRTALKALIRHPFGWRFVIRA